MAIQLGDIATLVRYLIEDTLTTDSFLDTYVSSSVFTLDEDNVTEVTAVLINDSEIGASLYSYDSSTNKVTITQSMTVGDTVEIQHSYYPKYSATEINNYVRSAIIHLSVVNYKNFVVKNTDYIYPTPEEEEKNIIALIASILLEPDNRTIRTPDLTIVVPKDVPTIEKIRHAIFSFKNNTHGRFFIG